MARLKYLWFSSSLLFASPAMAQRLGGGGELGISLTRIVMALVLCLMIAVAAILLLKRNGGRIDLAGVRKLLVAVPAQRRIEVIETRRVSQFADVCLFRCDGQEYLVLCAQHQQTLLRQGDVRVATAEGAA